MDIEEQLYLIKNKLKKLNTFFEENKKIGVLVTGDRNWSNDETHKKIVYRVLSQLKKKYIDLDLIEGGAKGLDSIAAEIAKELIFNVLTFTANWSKYGKAAGPIRNKTMLDTLLTYPIKIVIAFHDNLETSKGTKNMIGQAIKQKVIVYHFNKTGLVKTYN